MPVSPFTQGQTSSGTTCRLKLSGFPHHPLPLSDAPQALQQKPLLLEWVQGRSELACEGCLLQGLHPSGYSLTFYPGRGWELRPR